MHDTGETPVESRPEGNEKEYKAQEWQHNKA